MGLEKTDFVEIKVFLSAPGRQKGERGHIQAAYEQAVRD